MAISANTLFHFTKEESLISILKSQSFIPSYCRERFKGVIPSGSYYAKCLIPMVSFCDLTLTQVGVKHVRQFGKFGIGLKKEWGESRKVSPVLYVHNNSNSAHQINSVFNEVKKLNKGFQTRYVNLNEEMLRLFMFLKPYRSYYQKDRKQKKYITHYNEKEWRYVPNSNELKIIPFGDSEGIDHMRRLIKNSSENLFFNYSDIKYLIVDSDKSIDDFVKEIRKLKTTPASKNQLITKIITLNEIDEDF